jgi:hypothetical protein
VNATDLLGELERQGFTVAAEGEGVRVTPASRLTAELRGTIAAAKPELLALLRLCPEAAAGLKTIKGNQSDGPLPPRPCPGPDAALAAVAAIEAAADTPGRRAAAAAYRVAVEGMLARRDPYLMTCAADLRRVLARWGKGTA